MASRQETAHATARSIASANFPAAHALLGFDGFVDQIIDVVDKRHSPSEYDRLHTISQFGQKISLCAGKSANFELVVKQRKLGGNGPIMANALAALGFKVDYIGTVGPRRQGDPGCDPVFHEFARHATLYPLAPPANTSALEFLDGKVMLGDLAPLSQVTWSRLLDAVGLDRLRLLFEQASLLGMVNWTMLPHLTTIWQNVAEQILPQLSKRQRRIFIDLADPEKRTHDDLHAGLEVLAKLNVHVNVTLGLNLSEAVQVAKVLGLPPIANPEPAIRELASHIRAKLQLNTVVVHPRATAAAATADAAVHFDGPFVQQPAISTGAGDHFNAGFAVGQLLNLPLDQALCFGTALSGYYVRHAVSPTVPQLIAFLEDFPIPQR
jgi:sugar/nucleoside kinase (ribokinase family)